jgi:hypothetical protein
MIAFLFSVFTLRAIELTVVADFPFDGMKSAAAEAEFDVQSRLVTDF